MAPRVQLFELDGIHIYSVYNDNRELVREFESGEFNTGDEVIYRGQVCKVLYDFTDADGVKQMELLVKGGLGSNIQFQIL